MKLSILICVFNTKIEYLNECLKSIENSTINDYEIILIDDGSTVDYSKLLNKFDKIKYFKTENKGTLSARLLAISKATGDYISFVDSDDVVSFSYLEASLNFAQKNNLDIAMNDWAFWTEQTKYYCTADSTISTDFYCKKGEVLDKFFEKTGREHSFYVLWNKIFKREVLIKVKEEIEKLNLEKMVFAEDVLLTYFAYKHAKSLKNLHFGFYFYRIHDNQQISINDKDKLKNQIILMTEVFEIIKNDLVKSKTWEKYQNQLYDWKQLLCRTQYSHAKKSGYCDLIELIKEKYDEPKPKKSKLKDSSSYTHQKVLPTNLNEIDKQLKKIYFNNKYVKIYAKKHSYSQNILKKMKNEFNLNFNFSDKYSADVKMPKEKYSLKQRILHIDIVYFIGIFLFPKGSKIRKFLKSKL